MKAVTNKAIPASRTSALRPAALLPWPAAPESCESPDPDDPEPEPEPEVSEAAVLLAEGV